MIKRQLVALFLVLAMPLMACAQGTAEEYVAGTHYEMIATPIRTADPAKVEVTEFFWYGCGHCYNFEPMIGQWKKSLGEDVIFVGSPAAWNKPMELHAMAYYAAEALGVLDKMHPVLFQAMNVDKKRLSSETEIAMLFGANGVDPGEFKKAFTSFGVASQTRQANSRARAAKITGTPELMINGKYRVDARKAGSQANMLKIADFLIAKELAVLAQ